MPADIAPPGCDFCSADTPPAWVYPTEDFVMNVEVDADQAVTHVSTGSWLACVSCAELIEAAAWTSLAERAASVYVTNNPPARRAWASIMERVRELHRDFRRYRKDRDRVPFG